MAKIRPLAERDLSEAQRIVRRAFGTFMGVPDLDNFWTDFDYVYGRFGAEHTASFAADQEPKNFGASEQSGAVLHAAKSRQVICFEEASQVIKIIGGAVDLQ
jgi:hypothetical protein